MNRIFDKECNATHRLTTSAKTSERAIATVQPYSTKATENLVTKSASMLSMNESGVFDSDLLRHQFTQTELDDFPNAEATTLSSELCAEIQKLNKFRKKIEDCVAKCNQSSSTDIMMPMSKLDESRLQYYKDRLELLENKVLIYESSGDVQLKRLATRLQKEVQLQAMVKQLKQRVEKLEEENQQLDEERCELEEIENDTRLQLQRLEVDLEILSQRNSELKMSRDTERANVECLQETVATYHESMQAVEMERNEIRTQLDSLTAFMPAILLFGAWKMQQQVQAAGVLIEYDAHCVASPTKDSESCFCNQEHICPQADMFLELVRREHELSDNIAELNRAYNETLERADNLWAQMEKDYKDKLARSQEDNNLLRSKINQLEKRLKNDAHYAQERISQLEDEENVLKRRLAKLNKISRDDAEKYKRLNNDYQSLSQEYEKLKSYADGPLAESLEKERKKSRTMEEELRVASKMYNDIEQLHKTQMAVLKSKLEKSHKELLTAEVSNNELKEEVIALEHRIIELNRCRQENEEKIRSLIAENRSHDDQRPIKPVRIKHSHKNLAQELSPFARSNNINNNSNNNNNNNIISNLNYTSVYTLNSVASKISDSIKNFEVSKLFSSSSFFQTNECNKLKFQLQN